MQVIGEECETEKEAWLSFIEKLSTYKGFKIWRKVPSLYTDRRIETMKTVYLVKGHIAYVEFEAEEKIL